MKRRFSHSSDQSGVTLIELLVVIVIIAIVASIALMQRGSADAQFKRQNVARELKVAFERARFDSVKRRAVKISSSDDRRATVVVDVNSYSLTTYNVDSNSVATPSTQTTATSGQNVVIAGNNSITLPYTIYFNQRGEAVDVGGGTISPSFFVCNSTCSSPTTATANLIVVTPTGTINLLSGGSSVPNFNAPTISSNSNTNTINNTARLP